ncbi:hypothetical protein AB0M44_30550 [Streptosporangium subroseum]|uniref:hypothetical protein n=1 Tax=Streptosporangium subroseum TaxID=106412 RepID=UPI00342474A4
MKPGTWKLGDAPVGDRPTFLSHALEMSLRYGVGPWPEEAQLLPDEPPSADDGGVFISTAVLDGINTHHFRPGSDPGAVGEIADLLQSLVTAPPHPGDLARLHERAADPPALDIADALLDELRHRRLPKDRLHAVGRHLAEHGTRRNATKIGLVLVGACGDTRDRGLLLLLGALEEFTLYAVVALTRTQPDPQRAAYELARRVQGWGRIHAVERLEGCDDPEIKAWLLRDGFSNGIMDEYLAHLAATTGDLYSALLESEIDDDLLDGAGGILSALALGGPAEDMTDYADAVPALSRYAELIDWHEATVGRLNHLLGVAWFLRSPPEGLDWPDTDLRGLRDRYEELLRQPRWQDLVLGHLADPFRKDFAATLWTASRLGLPVVPHAMTYLDLNPLDQHAWHVAMENATPAEAALLTGLAERLLPLEELAGGPADHLAFGPGREADWILNSLVSSLGAFPGTGLPLIRVGLATRIIQIRRAALDALSAWPAEAVPEEALGWVRAALPGEPDDEVREQMAALTAGRTR